MKKKGFGANFTLLAAGQGLSLLGNSVLDLALSMYVLEHTGSASVYGALLAAAMLPGILLAPLGGVLADRADRRRLMVWLDLLNGGVALLCNGVAGVGAPFLISTRLGLSADWYGAAGSALGAFGITGSLAAGLLVGRMGGSRLAWVLVMMGGCLLPAEIMFLAGGGTMACYGTLVAAFCGMQLCAVVFSVFARSVVQRRVPGRMMGKLMALPLRWKPAVSRWGS